MTIDIGKHLERTPDLDQARRAATLAHGVVMKMKKMGLTDEMDGDLSQFCTDLADLWSAQQDLARQTEALLNAPNDWADVGDALADFAATVDHMAWHIKGIREPMDALTLHAYGRANGSQAESES